MRAELVRRRSSKAFGLRFWLVVGVLGQPVAGLPAQDKPPLPEQAQESMLFTPPGFTREGQVVRAAGEKIGRLEIRVRDAASGRLTAGRLNVVGPDGNYYQPETNYLSPYALTSEWPKPSAWGNRREKAPFRYLGRFFYTIGAVEVAVPPGKSRVEAAKGFEFAPVAQTVEVAAGQTKSLELLLTRTADVSAFGYFGGDPHFHFPRRNDQDDNTMLDLLSAEDLRFGVLLAYNEPMGPYAAFMNKLDSPQLRGLGLASVRQRDDYALMSGQEYRSTTYGHLLLYLRDTLVYPEQSFNADDWPVYGEVAQEVQNSGGLAIQAHGGYAQEIYADAALGRVNAVELLQFGIYRGMGLADWYDMLNTGYRFPITAASDWPACRFLGDCRTFVYAARRPAFADWLRGAIEGHSFVSTGPLLLLEIDGQGPGASFNKPGPGPHAVAARIRLRCEVTPVTHTQLIVNGEVVQSWDIPAGQQQGAWWEVERRLELGEACWIAARAWSTTPGGQSDAEAHTNPIYVYLNGRAPYRRTSLETWLARIEGQLSVHRQREFAEKARVLNYFEQARERLLQIRDRCGFDPIGSAPLPQGTSRQLPAEHVKPVVTLADFHLDERAAELTGRRNDPAELKQTLIALATASALRETPDLRARLVFALGRGLKGAGARLSAQDQFGPVVAQLLDEFRQSVRRVALDDRSPEQTRVRAIEQLGCLTLERVHEPLSRLSDAGQPAVVQIAAIGALADFTDPLATEILLRHWRQYPPAARPEAFRAMLRYEDRTLAWLRAAERGEVSLAETGGAERQSLLSHRSEEVAALARKVFGHATETGPAREAAP